MNVDASEHMDFLLALVVCGLATWRISSLFVSEEGPFEMFTNIRKRCGVHIFANSDPDISIVPDNQGQLARLLSCIWCFSVWATPIVWAIYALVPIVVFVIASMVIPIVIERFLSVRSEHR